MEKIYLLCEYCDEGFVQLLGCYKNGKDAELEQRRLTNALDKGDRQYTFYRVFIQEVK